MFQSTSQFSKRYARRWKTMSAKEKGKVKDMAKVDKVCCEKEMKTPPRGEMRKN